MRSAAHLERYAAGLEATVREGIEVTALQPGPNGGFVLETSAGEIAARTVVLSTGAYQRFTGPRARTRSS